ncbi:MAG: flagellar hook-basal body protein [Phycisphaeraceae bacterium]|nr:flagellar hook-basal body protein [Phycisphaeraceae bacterium]
MNYGLYLSASGVLTNLYRQDVFANNLANVQTTGFKPDQPALTQRPIERIEDQLGMRFSDRLLDQLGGGVFAGPQSIDFAVGSFQPTGNDLDVALPQRDCFFAVQHTHEKTGQTSVRLTRDGNFTRNAEGLLVNQSGQFVLDIDDQPIRLPDEGDVAISGSGQVTIDGEPLAQLQVARVADLSQLHKAGANQFAFQGADPRRIEQSPQVQTGALESSAADPVKTMVKMIAATRAATGSAQLMSYFDTLMDRAVNTLGRVA